MASNSDEISDKTRSVHFGVAIEDDNPFVGGGAPAREGRGGGANRRMSLTRSKEFREARSMRFTELNQKTGAEVLFVLHKCQICIIIRSAFVADAWVGKHYRRRFKYLMELVGTFILNISIGTWYEGLSKDFHPLAVVATIILVVTIGAPISGAHYNPALTVGFWLSGDRVAPSAVLYIVVICTSAILAHLLMYSLYLPVNADVEDRRGYIGGLPSYPSFGEWAQAMVAEFLGTYFAIFVVLYTALLANPPLGTFGPVMVGLGFYSSIMTFRTVSGAVLNPGLAVALWLVGMFNPQPQNGVVQYWNIIPYVAFEMLGGIFAGYSARAWIMRENQRKFTWIWDWTLDADRSD